MAKTKIQLSAETISSIYENTNEEVTAQNVQTLVLDIIDAMAVATALTGFTTSQYFTSGSTGNESIRAFYASGTTDATGDKSFAIGYNVIASGDNSSAFGENSIASGIDSHAEGQGAIANGQGAHSEGYFSQANGNYSHAQNNGTVAGAKSFVGDSIVNGLITINSFYGDVTSSFTVSSSLYVNDDDFDRNFVYKLVSISSTTFDGTNTFIQTNITDNFIDTNQCYVVGLDKTNEPTADAPIGHNSHAEGGKTLALGENSHAGGYKSFAIGTNSFVHGTNCIAVADNSFVTGDSNQILKVFANSWCTIIGGYGNIITD